MYIITYGLCINGKVIDELSPVSSIEVRDVTEINDKVNEIIQNFRLYKFVKEQLKVKKSKIISTIIKNLEGKNWSFTVNVIKYDESVDEYVDESTTILTWKQYNKLKKS